MGHRPGRVDGAIATSTRGGYCYQLNGAFAELLASLGYIVTCHAAGVHDAGGPTAATLTNHVAVIVHDLATANNPSGDWYVDTGLGDALHAPLPLVPGHYIQAPMRFAISRVVDGVGHWHVDNDPRGSLAGVSIVSDPVDIGVFAARHAFNTTSPDSSFARTVTCQRRHARGVDIVRGRVLTQRSGATVTSRVIEGQRDWVAMLSDVFGMCLDVTEEALAGLWARVCSTHDAWATSQNRGALATGVS